MRLNFFKKQDAKPATAVASLLHPVQYSAMLKPGKWVAVNNQDIGIVVGFPAPNLVSVHLVNIYGETIRETVVHHDSLRLARYEEIPEPRRPADRGFCAGLGYV